MNDFAGWPADTQDYFAELEANNNRDWYHENKTRLKEIESASGAFLDELAERYGGGETKIFRLQRDARFSKGQPPYKTGHRAGIMRTDGVVGWIDIEPDSITTAIGHPQWDKTQLSQFREAVAIPAEASTLAAALDHATSSGFQLDSPELKRPIRDLSEDHPHPNLSRHKHLTLARTVSNPVWLHSPDAVDVVVADWDVASKATSWLLKHIGRTTL